MNILGVNAVFHDPAAALVVDGHVVAAAEEERFSRRKHGKEAVPFSTWELPTEAAKWCLAEAGLTPADVDAVGYSYDPSLMEGQSDDLAGLDNRWEYLRTMYAQRASGFLATALPGLDPAVVRHVRHHVAHAASTALASPDPDSAVLVVDGRGERSSMRRRTKTLRQRSGRFFSAASKRASCSRPDSTRKASGLSSTTSKSSAWVICSKRAILARRSFSKARLRIMRSR